MVERVTIFGTEETNNLILKVEFLLERFGFQHSQYHLVQTRTLENQKRTISSLEAIQWI